MMKRALFLFIAGVVVLQGECPEETIPPKTAWRSRVRIETLKNLDEFLNWHLGKELRTYALQLPAVNTLYSFPVNWMGKFELLHGFFSPYQPLVGKVSAHADDLASTRCLLQRIAEALPSKVPQKFAAEEALTKVLAYRDLHVDERWQLPCVEPSGKMKLLEYRVDEVFNLWLGMPAYGLEPLSEGVPILLFRGTDFSLDAPRGWASLMSDVDLSGPGLHAFQKAQPKIHAWLEKQATTGKKARVMGYSLGGALAAYAYIFENEWIADKGSCAFNLPGVSEAVIAQFNALPKERKAGFVSYVNRGDVVSKVGLLFGSVYELALDEPLKPLTAHTIFLSAQNQFVQNQVDVSAENKTRKGLTPADISFEPLKGF